MNRHIEEVEEGKQITLEYAARCLQSDGVPGWGASVVQNGEVHHPLNVTRAGHADVLIYLAEDELADVPGSAADRSGDDLGWPVVRGKVKAVILAWKADQGAQAARSTR